MTVRASRPIELSALGACEALAGSANFLFLPSLPQLTSAMNSSASDVLVTTTAYLLCFGAGLLCSGFLIDRFGCRVTLLWGLMAACLSGLIGLGASSLGEIAVARCLHGIAAGMCLMGARGMLIQNARDATAAVLLARLAMIVLTLTATAAAISGIVVEAWRWKGAFALLAGAGAALTVLVVLGVGTNAVPAAARAKSEQPAGWPFSWLKSRGYLLMLLCNCLIFSSYQVFVSAAPWVAVERWGASTQTVANGSLALLLGYFAGATILASGRVCPGRLRVLYVPVIVQFACGAALLCLARSAVEQTLFAYGLMTIVSICHGVLLPCLYSRAVASLGEHIGVASSIFYFSPLAASALSVYATRSAAADSWETSGLFVALTALVVAALIAFYGRVQQTPAASDTNTSGADGTLART